MKHYKINGKVLSCAALAVFASVAHAEGETAPDFNSKGKVAVKVKNTLDIVEQSQLNFGLIAAVASELNTASLPLNATTGTLGTPTNSGSASITSIDNTSVSPGIFQVANAAKYTDLNIELPTSDVNLVMGNAGPGSLAFKLSNFTAAVGNDAVTLAGDRYHFETGDKDQKPLYEEGGKYFTDSGKGTEVTNTTEGTTTGGAGKAKTDGNGNLELKVGATLSTITYDDSVTDTKDGPTAYSDAVYNGTYAVIIKY